MNRKTDENIKILKLASQEMTRYMRSPKPIRSFIYTPGQ